MPKTLMIGDLAAATATKVNTIRFYEEIGLMRPAARTASNRRTYGDEDLRRLRFIRNARALGFDTAEIRSLLALGDRPRDDCGTVSEIARGHLSAIEIRIGQLKRLKRELARMTEACEGGAASACSILEALAGADRADAATVSR